MSDDSDDEIRSTVKITPRRASARKSINSDDDDEPPTKSIKKRSGSKQSGSDSISEQSGSEETSSPMRTPNRRSRPTKVRSKPKALESKGSSKGFVKDTYETVRERFLEDNQSGDSSLEEWMTDNDEPSDEGGTDSGDSSGSEASALEESDNLQTQDSQDQTQKSNEDEQNLEGNAKEANVSPVKKSQSDEEDDVTPCKKLHGQRLHSDDSESDGKPPPQDDVDSVPGKKKRKKKRRRVIEMPDSLEADNEQSDINDADGSDVDSNETETSSDDMSDFVVDDTESVTAEDGSEPIMYPEVEYHASTTKLMSHSQAFRVVMEAMVLRALNPEHFETEEFRANNDIAEAFKKVFGRLDSLMNDIKSQAWCKDFGNAMEFTDFTSTSWGNYVDQLCEACCRRDRYASYSIEMSGYRYDRRSLKPIEAESAEASGDDEDSVELANKTFYVGKYCEERAQMYHDTLHCKHTLLLTCIAKATNEKFAEESADDIIEELIVKKPDWIDDEYRLYNSLLDRTAKLIHQRSNMTTSDFIS